MPPRASKKRRSRGKKKMSTPPAACVRAASVEDGVDDCIEDGANESNAVRELGPGMEDVEVDVAQACRPTPVTVQDLSDDVLVRVFGCLDPMFLANSVSRVCRRWQGLASDPVLWVDVSLAYRDSACAGTFLGALAVAPILEGLDCLLTDADPPALRGALEASRTGVMHLCVDLEAAAPDAVLRLLANSRLTLQVLCVREAPLCCGFSEKDARRFWQLVEQCSRLTSLVLLLSERSGLAYSAHRFRPRSRAALRTLLVDMSMMQEHQHEITIAKLDATLESLVTAHRLSLREVHLPRLVLCPRAVLAVSKCPSVERVSMTTSSDVHLLAACPQLRVLKMTLDLARVQARPVASATLLDHLGQLRQLTHLRLSHLLSRPSTLVFEMLAGAAALPLKELSVSSLPSPATLCALPASMNMAVLAFEQGCGTDKEGCRLPAFRHLLRQHTRLHLIMENVAMGPLCGADHGSVVDAQLQVPVAFVGHAPDTGCDHCPKHRLAGGGVFHFDCHEPDDLLRTEGLAVWVMDVDDPPLTLAKPKVPERRMSRRRSTPTASVSVQQLVQLGPNVRRLSAESLTPSLCQRDGISSAPSSPPLAGVSSQPPANSSPPKGVPSQPPADSSPPSGVSSQPPADSSPPSGVSSQPPADSSPPSGVSSQPPADSSSPSGESSQHPADPRPPSQHVANSSPVLPCVDVTSQAPPVPVPVLSSQPTGVSSPASAFCTQVPVALTLEASPASPANTVSTKSTADLSPMSAFLSPLQDEHAEQRALSKLTRSVTRLTSVGPVIADLPEDSSVHHTHSAISALPRGITCQSGTLSGVTRLSSA